MAKRIMKSETKIDRVLVAVERELKALFHHKLSDIILFGSHVRGDHDQHSDIDIIALIHETDLKKYDRQLLEIIVDLSIQYDVNLSIFTENKAEFDANVEIIPLFKNIHQEGLRIYKDITAAW